MKPNQLYYFLIAILFLACSEVKKESISSEIILKKVFRDHGLTDQLIQKSEKDTSTFWKTVKGDVEVFSEITEKGITIKTVNKNHQRIINLGKVEEAYQLPKVEWISKDFVCIHTFTKKEQTANIFFIPYNSDKSISFFNKEIVAIAPEENTFVYISNIGNPIITYAVYNVLTKKELLLEAQITKQKAEFPYFDAIKFKDKKVIITMDQPKEEYVLEYDSILK
ncbi:MAG: hypothetical protein LW701_06400 [Fluviicola sp.]|nr:hypothetical protein [Fluviicola sp.]